MKKIFLKLLILSFIFVFLSFFPSKSIAQGPLVGPTSGKLAVTPSGYDNMSQVLQQMGFSADEISWSDLGNLSKLKEYSAVYINCSGDTDSVETVEALKSYVEQGGVIYASDYANSIIDKAFPGKITFYNAGAQGARVGNSGKVSAKVTDSGLAAALGKNQIEVNFDLPAWAVIESTTGQVYVSGNINAMDYSAMTNLPDLSGIDFTNPQSLQSLTEKFEKSTSKPLGEKPLVVAFGQGKGEVLYTSFHNEAQPTEDVKPVLNWFAIRTKSSGLVSQTRALATQGGGRGIARNSIWDK